MLVDELENSLHDGLGALVLKVSEMKEMIAWSIEQENRENNKSTWMYRSAVASRAHTVSTLTQHWMKPEHARFSSSSP